MLIFLKKQGERTIIGKLIESDIMKLAVKNVYDSSEEVVKEGKEMSRSII